MQRVMIVGQPGSGKSTLARAMAARTGLPVFQMDHSHWQAGKLSRPPGEKDRICAAVEALPAWIFKGNYSRTTASRIARAAMLIWLDIPLWHRVWRVTRRSFRQLGQGALTLPPAARNGWGGTG